MRSPEVRAEISESILRPEKDEKYKAGGKSASAHKRTLKRSKGAGQTRGTRDTRLENGQPQCGILTARFSPMLSLCPFPWVSSTTSSRLNTPPPPTLAPHLRHGHRPLARSTVPPRRRGLPARRPTTPHSAPSSPDTRQRSHAPPLPANRRPPLGRIAVDVQRAPHGMFPGSDVGALAPVGDGGS